MEQILKLYTYVNGVNDTPFPSAEEQMEIHSFKYTAQRMGGAPSITATTKHRLCLDGLWNVNVYAEFNGERYYIMNTPSSSKNNEDTRYEYDIELLSEREKLNHIYFLDAVQGDSTIDRYLSNSPKVYFMGDIKEFVDRLNASLQYSNLDYTAVIDAGITSESKLVDFENLHILDALQQIYNVYSLPYYFVGKTIHIGYVQNAIPNIFRYGIKDALLSIERNNANYEVVRRCSGYGSSDNIPYYYPNTTPSGTAIYETENIEHYDVQSIDLGTVLKYNANVYNDTFVLGYLPTTFNFFLRDSDSAFLSYAYYFKGIKSETLTTGILDSLQYSQEENYLKLTRVTVVNQLNIGTCRIGCFKVWLEKGGIYKTINELRFIEDPNLTYVGPNDDYRTKLKYTRQDYYYYISSQPITQTASEVLSNWLPESLINLVKFGVEWNGNGGFIDFSFDETTPKYNTFIAPSSGYYAIIIKCNINYAALAESAELFERIIIGGYFSAGGTEKNNLRLSCQYDTGNLSEKYFFQYGDGKRIGYSESGIKLLDVDDLPKLSNRITSDEYGHVSISSFEGGLDVAAKIRITGRTWIIPANYLMPPIYRQTNGVERFYNAENNKYQKDDGSYYSFVNLYTDHTPNEWIQQFEDIKPTIKGMTNAAGGRIDMFLDFAYDENDSDEFDPENNNEYLHPYFFAKLRKFDGEFGFNLFDYASESGAMQITMQDGVCGACTFEIGVGEETNKNTVQVDASGNLLRDENGNVRCGREGLQEETPQDRQNDTVNYEVWIALKKDNSTYKDLMPNKARNLRPSTNDTFEILNINLPQAYIDNAENQLEKAILDYMWLNNTEKFTFSINFSRIYFAENPSVLALLNENSSIIVEYNNIQNSLYVSNFEYNVDEKEPLPEITVDLTDNLTIGQNSLQNLLNGVEQNVIGAIGYPDVATLGAQYFLRKDVADTARSIITFLQGFLVGSGIYGVDGAGKGTLDELVVNSLQATLAKITSADISEITSSIIFKNLATFLGGLVTDNVESGDFLQGYDGFRLSNTPGGNSRLEVDELLVRVKAIFNELEIRKLSYVGGNIELSAAGSTIYRVRELGRPADGNLVADSDFPELDPATMVGDPEHPDFAYLSSTPKSDGLAEYNELHIEVSGRGALLYCGLYYDLAATPGGTYTVSCYYRTEELGDGGAMELSALLEEGGDEYYKFPIGDDGGTKMELLEAADDTRVSATVTMPSSCSRLKVKIWMRKNGHFVFSRPRVEAGSVATPWSAANRWRCYFVKDDGTTRTRNWWKVGDQAKCQTFNIDGDLSSTASFLSVDGKMIKANGGPLGYRSARSGSTGNRYYWRLVTAVGTETLEDGKDYDWADLSNEETVQLVNTDGETVTCIGYDTVFDGYDDLDDFKWHEDVNDAPQEGDEIVQEGSQTDPDRQHIIRLSVVGENAPAIEEFVGVGSSTTTDEYPKAGPYDLIARRMTAIAPRTGNIFRAKRFEIVTDNNLVVRVPTDRGEWKSDGKYGYYDRVSHNGSLWLCVNKNGTTTEPKEGNTSWQLQVAAGQDGQPGADGALNAVRTELTPSTLIIEESGEGQFDLTSASFRLRVLRGLDEDITSQCEVTGVSSSYCTAHASTSGIATVIQIDSIIGKPDSGTVNVSVRIPAEYAGGTEATVACRGSFYINYLGTFRETIENDVKTQIASKEFTYTDADGTPHTVQGVSQLVQSAEGFKSEVLKIQPAGNAIADGKFADGLAKWGVSGDVALTALDGWPCVGISKNGVLEQTSNNMLCNWAQLTSDYGDIYVTVKAQVRSMEDTYLYFSMENYLGGTWFQVPGDGEWMEVYTQGYISGDPGYLRFQNKDGAEIWVKDIQLIPDIDAALGSKIEQTADGIRTEVTGLGGRVSTLEQTADGFEFAVQATNNVIVNGNFAEDGDKWQVSDSGVAGGAPSVVEKEGVKCVKLPSSFIDKLSQNAADMNVDWAATMGVKEGTESDTDSTLEATVGFRYYANSSANLIIGLVRGGSYVTGSAMFQVTSGNVGAWNTAKVSLALKSYIPDTFYLGIAIGSAEVWVTDIYLVGDFNTLLGSRITMSEDKISLKVQAELGSQEEKLLATGIDITNKEIVATSDNFVIQNNSGEETMRVDKEGQLNITKLSASSDGAYVTLSYETAEDGTTSPVLKGIDSNGRLIWTFNGESHMNTSDDVDMTILSTSSARLAIMRYSSYDRYNMSIVIKVKVTNRSNALITYTGNQLVCQMQKWNHAIDSNILNIPLPNQVQIASGQTKEVTFTADYYTNVVTSGGEIDVIPVSIGDVLQVKAYYGGVSSNGLRDSAYLTVTGIVQ